jgi:hypothetical protein
MASIIQKLSPEWALRLALGAMYLYSGYDLFMNPNGWTWAIRQLPDGIESIIASAIGTIGFIKFQGIGELVMAVLFLAWFLPRWTLKFAAALSVLEMGGILLLVGVDLQTFRDIGLFGASVALLIIANKTPFKT